MMYLLKTEDYMSERMRTAIIGVVLVLLIAVAGTVDFYYP